MVTTRKTNANVHPGQVVIASQQTRRSKKQLQDNNAIASAKAHASKEKVAAELLRFSLGLLRTAYLPVMTMARTAPLVMDSYLVALYQVYDSDSFLGSL